MIRYIQNRRKYAVFILSALVGIIGNGLFHTIAQVDSHPDGGWAVAFFTVYTLGWPFYLGMTGLINKIIFYVLMTIHYFLLGGLLGFFISSKRIILRIIGWLITIYITAAFGFWINLFIKEWL